MRSHWIDAIPTRASLLLAAAALAFASACVEGAGSSDLLDVDAGVAVQQAAITARPDASCTYRQYGGHDYWVCTAARTWAAAQTTCASVAMHLARPDDSAETDFIRSQIGGTSWIGGGDQVTEGQWRWVDNNDLFWSGGASGSAQGGRYTRWVTGEPNNTSNQDCAELRTSDGKWSDNLCTATRAFVCESSAATAAVPQAPDTACTVHTSGGSTYWVCDNQRSWDAARARCRGIGMDLVSIDSSTESNFVQATARSGHHIGLTDREREGDWRRPHNDRLLWCGDASGTAQLGLYTNWASGQPTASANDCYPFQGGGKSYYFCGAILPWSDARAQCQGSAGMSLAKIESPTENELVYWNLWNDVWIGASDLAQEGSWTWDDGTSFWSGGPSGSPVSGAYAPWVPGEPNNLYNDEDCGVMLSWDGYWNDDSCACAWCWNSFLCEGWRDTGVPETNDCAWAPRTGESNAGRWFANACSTARSYVCESLPSAAPEPIPPAGTLARYRADRCSYDCTFTLRCDDMSGNGNIAFAPSSGNQPGVIDNRIGGKPALASQAGDKMQFGNPSIDLGSSYTLVIVGQYMGQTAYPLDLQPGDTAAGHVRMSTNGQGEIRLLHDPEGTTGDVELAGKGCSGQTQTPLTSGQPYVAVVVGTQEQLSFYLNNALQQYSPAPATPLTLYGTFADGAQAAPETYGHTVAETIFYDRALTTEELATLQTYVQGRYGIASATCPAATCVGAGCVGCGNGIVSGEEVCDPGADARCASDCSGIGDHTLCLGDIDCGPGQRCVPDNAVQWKLGMGSVCAPEICATEAVLDNCGSLDAICGFCPCTPDCAGKSCGEDLSDGCGGICPGVCDSGGGCELDSDCADSAACVPGAARAFDPSAGLEEAGCMPTECLAPEQDAIDCGESESTCGACLGCTPNCESMTCGEQDGCGGICPTGSCENPSTTCIGGACVTALSLIHPALDESLEDVDTTESTLLSSTRIQVTSSGAAHYSMPIPVPPGRAGVAPSLALTYESTGGYGYVGRGWALQGLSRIHRCGRNLALEEYSSGVDGSVYDAYCLDGQRLIEQGDGAFVTEPDTHVRVRSTDAGGAWEVRTKEGMLQVYEPLMDGAGVSAPENNRVWLLDRVIDRSGNAWQVEYESDVTSTNPDGEALRMSYWPEYIVYTQHYSAQTAQAELSSPSPNVNRIDFTYDDTPCRIVGDTGVAIYQCKRLRAISATAFVTQRVDDGEEGEEEEVEVVEQRVGTLVIEYTGELVSAITRYAADEGSEVGDRLTFTYSTAPDERLGLPISTPLATTLHDRRGFRMVGDFDGDGGDDLVIYHHGTSRLHLYSMPRDTSFRKVVATDFNPAPYGLTYEGATKSIADFDGDGANELLLIRRSEFYLFELSDNTFVPADFDFDGVMVSSSSARTLVGDVTGDGLPDLVQCGSFPTDHAAEPGFEGEVVMRNTGSSFELFAQHAADGDAGFCEGTKLIDLDGDGAQEVVRNAPGQNDDEVGNLLAYRYSVQRDNGPSTPIQNMGYPGIHVSRLIFGDFNGDGLPDLARPRPYLDYPSGYLDQQAAIQIGLNRGAFAHHNETSRTIVGPWASNRELNASLASAVAVDLNHDGYDELLWSGGGRWHITHYYPEFRTDDSVEHDCPDSETVPAPMLGDFNRDGATDAMALWTCESVLFEGSMRFGAYGIIYGERNVPNLLTTLESAVSGPGDVVEYTASPAPDPSYFPEDEPTPTFEFMPGNSEHGTAEKALRAPPWPLVSNHIASSSAEADGLWTQYFYKGSFSNRIRKQWIGFAEREVRVHPGVFLGAPIANTERYEYDFTYDEARQVHPFAQLAKTKVTWRAWSPGLLSGNAEPGAPDVEQITTTNVWEQTTSLQGSWFPSLTFQTVETETFHGDESRGVGSTVSSELVTDDRGNRTDERRTTQRNGHEVESTRTESTYFPVDQAAWRIADLERVQTSGCVAGYDEAAEAWTATDCGPTSFPVSFTYDDSGLLESITKELPDGEVVLSYTDRDDFGNIEALELNVPDRDTLTVLYDYDDETHTYVLSAAHSTGLQIHTNYDPRFGNLTHRRIEGPGAGSEGVSTPDMRYAYDGFGRLGRVVHHDGTETLITYAPASQDPPGAFPAEYSVSPRIQVRTIMRAADGESPEAANLGDVTEQLDKWGRSVRSIAAGRAGTVIMTERHYNSLGLIETETRPHLLGDYSQEVIRSAYDEQGRLVALTRPGLETLYFERTHLDLVADEYRDELLTRYGPRHSSNPATPKYVSVETGGVGDGLIMLRDARGHTLVSQDYTGSYITYEYSRHGSAAAAIDPYGQKRSWSYDDGGRLIGLVSPESSTMLETAAGGQSATFEYYGDDLVREESVSEGGTSTFVYDVYGRLTNEVTEEGETIYTWDDDEARELNTLGKLMRIDGPNAASLLYEYDENQELRTVTQQLSGVGGQSSSLTVETITEHGKLVSLTYPQRGASPPQGPGPLTLIYDYDAHGNVTSASADDDGDEKTYWSADSVYQGWGVSSETRLGGTVTRGFDDLTGAMTSVSYENSPVSAGVSYGYDAKGRVRSRRYLGDGGEQIFDYDPAGRLDQVWLRVDGVADLLAYDYAYDAVGNLLSSPAGVHITRAEEEGRGNGTRRLLGPDGDSEFEYDGQGRQWHRSGPAVAGGEQTIFYTSFDLPRQIVTGLASSGTVTELEYAPNHSRAWLSGPDLSVLYFEDLFEERNATPTEGLTTRDRIYRVMVPGIGVVAEVTDHSENGGSEARSHSVVLSDLTESTFAVHEEGAPTIERYFFTPFGAPLSSEPQRARFGGHGIDAELGLVNMRGRIYDATLGNFITQDPVLPGLYDPQSFSSYAYVRNSPLNGADSTGFECDSGFYCPPPPITPPDCLDCPIDGDDDTDEKIEEDAEDALEAQCKSGLYSGPECARFVTNQNTRREPIVPTLEDWEVGPSTGPANSTVAPPPESEVPQLFTPPGAEPADGFGLNEKFIPDPGVDATSDWIRSLRPGEGFGPGKNWINLMHADAYGHCWAACNYSSKNGPGLTFLLGGLRELYMMAFEPQHKSFIDDVYNEWVGRGLNELGQSCSEGCATAISSDELLMTAPVEKEKWYDLTLEPERRIRERGPIPEGTRLPF